MLVKLFEKPVIDEKEKELRGELLRYASGIRSDWMFIPPSKLEHIKEQLQLLGGKSPFKRFTDNVQDGDDVSGLIEGLREAVDDYMVCL